MEDYSVYDLKEFYKKREGRLVRRLLKTVLNEIWPQIDGLRVMGYGYPLPYMRYGYEKAERLFAVLPSRTGGHFWPEGKNSLVCLSREDLLPVETESIDRLIVIHGLEHAADLAATLSELWRVLKSNGRMIVIVPNRLGMWARAERTPFGHGTPYTQGQIISHLKESLFTVERHEHALYMPPFRSFWVMRTAYLFEGFGKFIFPGVAGVNVIEAGKQIYAGTSHARKAMPSGTRIFVPQPAVK